MTRAQQIILASGAWAVLALATLIVLDALSITLYFAVCLIGFLAIAQASGPFVARPRWRARLNVAMLVGVGAFFLVVAMKVLDILKINPF